MTNEDNSAPNANSPQVRIRTRPNGPFVIHGPVTLVDHLGNPFTLPTDKDNVALCRCGHSAKKPFCDGSHKNCGFIAEELAGSGDASQAGL